MQYQQRRVPAVLKARRQLPCTHSSQQEQEEEQQEEQEEEKKEEEGPFMLFLPWRVAATRYGPSRVRCEGCMLGCVLRSL